MSKLHMYFSEEDIPQHLVREKVIVKCGIPNKLVVSTMGHDDSTKKLPVHPKSRRVKNSITKVLSHFVNLLFVD